MSPLRTPDTHLSPQGWRDSALPSLSPGTQQPHLATHGLELLAQSWPAGAKGCGDVSGCSHSPEPSTFHKAPAEGLRAERQLHAAKGSFTPSARNRKFSCPRPDLFYSYSGKYDCGSQHLQQLRTGMMMIIIRSARPPGPVRCGPAPQPLQRAMNAGSARLRLRFCRRGCGQEP